MVQVVGNANSSTPVEVDANTHALHGTYKADDYATSGAGIYALGATSGTMAAGLAAASPVFVFRWSPASFVAVVKKVIVTASVAGTAFTAGVGRLDMFAAHYWVSADTGGTDLTPAGGSNQNKLRTNMSTSLTNGTGSIRISSTAALGVGARQAELQPMASAALLCPATTSGAMLTPVALFDARACEQPLLLTFQDGFIIQATVTATGTWSFSVSMVWEELASYA